MADDSETRRSEETGDGGRSGSAEARAWEEAGMEALSFTASCVEERRMVSRHDGLCRYT